MSRSRDRSGQKPARSRKRPKAILREFKDKRQYLLLKSDGRCHYCRCGIALGNLSADHYIPLSRGGDRSYSNVVASCKTCNVRKGHMLPEEFIALLNQERKAL